MNRFFSGSTDCPARWRTGCEWAGVCGGCAPALYHDPTCAISRHYDEAHGEKREIREAPMRIRMVRSDQLHERLETALGLQRGMLRSATMHMEPQSMAMLTLEVPATPELLKAFGEDAEAVPEDVVRNLNVDVVQCRNPMHRQDGPGFHEPGPCDGGDGAMYNPWAEACLHPRTDMHIGATPDESWERCRECGTEAHPSFNATNAVPVSEAQPCPHDGRRSTDELRTPRDVVFVTRCEECRTVIDAPQMFGTLPGAGLMTHRWGPGCMTQVQGVEACRVTGVNGSWPNLRTHDERPEDGTFEAAANRVTQEARTLADRIFNGQRSAVERMNELARNLMGTAQARELAGRTMLRCGYYGGPGDRAWRCVKLEGHLPDGIHWRAENGPLEVEVVDNGDGRTFALKGPWNIPARLIHCDPLMLHAPGVCGYCDAYGADLQQQRAARGIAFTQPGPPACAHGWPLQHEPHAYHVAPCSSPEGGASIIPDPCEVARPGGEASHWPGNRPARRPAEVDEVSPLLYTMQGGRNWDTVAKAQTPDA